MIEIKYSGDPPWDRIERAVEKVKDRLRRVARLVKMKLTSYRDKDRVHVRDMVSIGLIDAMWLERFSPQLRSRLQELLDNPDG